MDGLLPPAKRGGQRGGQSEAGGHEQHRMVAHESPAALGWFGRRNWILQGTPW